MWMCVHASVHVFAAPHTWRHAQAGAAAHGKPRPGLHLLLSIIVLLSATLDLTERRLGLQQLLLCQAHLPQALPVGQVQQEAMLQLLLGQAHLPQAPPVGQGTG